MDLVAGVEKENEETRTGAPQKSGKKSGTETRAKEAIFLAKTSTFSANKSRRAIERERAKEEDW